MFSGEPIVVGSHERMGLFKAFDFDRVVFDVLDCAEEDFVAWTAPDGVVFAKR